MTGVGNGLTGVLKQVAGSACGCGARAWSMAVERRLIGAVLRLELRSR